MNFNLISFGETLRNIRGELNLTLDDVSKLSGVNSETIRRIELGKVIPKFETLEFLSPIYKQDLNAIFLKYRVDDYYYFYKVKNRLERKIYGDEFDTLYIELEELNICIKYIKSSFYKKLIEQLILLTHAIILYKNNDDNEKSLNKLIEAIKITTPDFSLEDYNLFIYSSMEIRILMNMAFVLNRLKHEDKYQEIMEFCISSVEPNDEMYPKLCHNLAGVYRRNRDFEKALKFSNIGIDACQKTGNFNGLSILYYGKGIAEYKLNKIEYKKSLETSIVLCEAFGQKELKDKIISNCKKFFGIKLQKHFS